MCKTFGLIAIWIIVCALGALNAFAFDDEPNELNWDRLGGSQTAFAHFCNYVETHPDFASRLLKQTPSNRSQRSTSLPEKVASVWVPAETFADRLENNWTLENVADRRVATYPAGHGGGSTRVKISVPKAGFYRVWTEYYHEQGTTASFVLRLERPEIAELARSGQTLVQDVFDWKFDWAEMGRQNAPLPNRKDEPTGFIWETSPTLWLDAGERTLSISGVICDEPCAPRPIASIVLTEEPIAPPCELVESTKDAERANKDESSIRVQFNAPSLESQRVAEIWARRPVIDELNDELVKLWSEWRESFFEDLADYRVPGIEGRRLASLAAFDPTSNLIGTPRQIRDEKERTREFLESFPQDVFLRKIEGEEFVVREGWNVENSSDASDAQILVASYGDGLARAEYEFDVPKKGVYSFWSRYLELPGYLSKFQLRIEGADKRAEEIVFCADEAENKRSPGFRWLERRVELPKGRVKLTLSKENGPSTTYRRFDALIVTDAKSWRPDGRGAVVAPRLSKNDLVLWNSDPWKGFDRFSAPDPSDVLNDDSKPIRIDLPLGAVRSASILARNEGDAPRTIQPEILNDDAGLSSWRLQASLYSPQFGWTPQPLLERSTITIPPGETAGIWLTFDGDVVSDDESIALKLDDQIVRFDVSRQDDLRDAPVPLVGGWNAPYETVSCWETFKKLGLNVINDVVVSKEVAKRYGIRLILRLNDSDVSPEHIRDVQRLFRASGYSRDDWAWSLMDEPGASASDHWVELAKRLRQTAPEVRLWCNPGELYGAPPESDLKMLPFVDCYCPYADHYGQNGGGNADYLRELTGQGRKYAIRLTYTTPCIAEKALGAPFDMFGPKDISTRFGLDGWMFYALLGRYEYCNSVWDETNAYSGDQSIYLYPGASYRTISTRNAEAIRAAVDSWRSERVNSTTRADQ